MRTWLLKQACLVAVTVVNVALVSCVPAANESAVPIPEATPTALAYTPPTVPPESHDLNQADIERLMEELSNWGRWGPSDELGAANLITPAKRLEAIALATEGIQKGHMTLHARSVVTAAGVPDEIFDEVLDRVIQSGDVKIWKAQEIVCEIQREKLGASGLSEKKGSEELAMGIGYGKVVLLGEHSVVYGSHAIGVPVHVIRNRLVSFLQSIFSSFSSKKLS